MTVLLSWQGMVLSRHRATGALMQCGVGGNFDEADPIDLGIAADRLQASFDDYLRADPGFAPIVIPEGRLQGWVLQRAADGRSVSVSHEGQYLCASQGSEGLELRSEAKAWEWFLPVSDADFRVLREVLRRNWIIRSSGELAGSAAIGLGEHWSLRLGSLWLDLRFQLPFDLSSWPHRLTVLRDGWRIEQICLYRPLVYYAAFGDPAIMGQFALSVRSLRAVGGYAGPVAVMSDHPAVTIAALLGEPAVDGAPADGEPDGVPVGGCTVLARDARDRTAFMSARYTVADWAEAWAFQPILYVDTDIVFEADVAPVLRAIATSDRLAAPFEPAGALSRTASVGAGLLQLDGYDPRDRLGFNSGTIGIPNLAVHAGTLRLICRVLANHADQRGRVTLTHGDQEVTNYVACRTGTFDTTLLARFVRVGGDDVLTLAGQRVIAHFWASPTPERRFEAMRRHMRRLGMDV